jgi:HK97 family phage major capsid protein
VPSLADLRLKKGQLAEDAKLILTTASDQQRDVLNPEEETRFNAIHTDIEALTKQIKMLERQADVEADLAISPGRKTEPAPLDTRDGRSTSRLQQSARDHAQAVRAWFLAGSKSTAIPQEYRQSAQRIGLDLSSNQLVVRLAANGLEARTPTAIERWQLRHDEEQRANAGPQSTTSVGGYLIQDAAMREIEIALLAFGGMRQVSTILRTDTGGPLPIPTVNDTHLKGHLIGEGVTVATQDVTFGQLVLDAWKYTSDKVLISVELMQDSSVNLQQLLGRLLGERLGRAVNYDYTLGTGTGQPNGIVTAATFTQATTGSSTSITLANLINLYHSVDPAYRMNAKWMMNDNTISKLKQMLDTSGRPLWMPSLAGGTPDTLLGSPYVINQDMQSMTITGKSILFGDFSKYWIRDVRDFTFVRLDERYAEFLQVAFLAYLRTDGDLLDAGTHPVKGYQNATG